MKSLLLAFCLASSFAVPALAAVPQDPSVVSHSGGTDGLGCHYNRKTGVYHCH